MHLPRPRQRLTWRCLRSRSERSPYRPGTAQTPRRHLAAWQAASLTTPGTTDAEGRALRPCRSRGRLTFEQRALRLERSDRDCAGRPLLTARLRVTDALVTVRLDERASSVRHGQEVSRSIAADTVEVVSSLAPSGRPDCRQRGAVGSVSDFAVRSCLILARSSATLPRSSGVRSRVSRVGLVPDPSTFFAYFSAFPSRSHPFCVRWTVAFVSRLLLLQPPVLPDAFVSLAVLPPSILIVTLAVSSLGAVTIHLSICQR